MSGMELGPILTALGSSAAGAGANAAVNSLTVDEGQSAVVPGPESGAQPANMQALLASAQQQQQQQQIQQQLLSQLVQRLFQQSGAGGGMGGGGAPPTGPTGG